jgi:D-sedoheptulose 7-phosphate isomerase
MIKTAVMEKLVFTNGCFDILHPGHIDLLERARALGTKLVVGINSDESVRKIKGVNRPFISENDRALILKGLKAVDEVLIFSETTPEKIIRQIKPDVLVKGGDWQISEIIGADFVLQNGGEVYSLPLKGDYSSSGIVERVQSSEFRVQSSGLEKNIFENSLNQHLDVFQNLLAKEVTNIQICAEMILGTLQGGKKILFCGNGGSAADAQHLAAEFVGRYEAERRAFPAIALTTDTSALTALANDYSFERVFARQIEALANEGDLLVAISTSGNSPNVLSAVMQARAVGCQIIGLTGSKGKKLASLCDASILVPAERTPRIQEAHITVGHLWCEFIDSNFDKK